MEVYSLKCPLMPMRAMPDHRAEMVSQVLFGEKFLIAERNNSWIRITCLHDQYSGWIESDQFQPLNKDLTLEMIDLSFQRQRVPEGILWLPFGSFVPVRGDFKAEPGNSIRISGESDLKARLNKFIHRFNGAPYLWGGRTAMGIDCSGLSQLFMRFLGVDIPRDASQQVESGQIIDVAEARAGDLAFFSNISDAISHVGIIIDSKRIFHASGNVRIDLWDKTGILRKPEGSLSHRLRSIRRLISL